MSVLSDNWWRRACRVRIMGNQTQAVGFMEEKKGLIYRPKSGTISA